MTVRRFDLSQISNAARTPQGYLRAPAFATRSGVFVYKRADGSVVRELRHPDDVFDETSLSTLAGVPVTHLHPPNGALLDASNTRLLARGFTGEAIGRQDEYVTAHVTITDAALIAEVEGDTQELSCGYECDLFSESGMYDGIPYDVRQKNIVYNHLAVVPRGRAGPQVRLRLDSDDAVQVENTIAAKGNEMEKILIGGKEFEVTPEVAAAVRADQASSVAAINAVKARADASDAKVDGLTADLAKAKTAQSEAEAKATKTDSTEEFQAKYKARKTLDAIAEKVLDAEAVAKLDSMSDAEIRVAVIKAQNPEVKLDGKSDAYIEARFDHIAEGIGNGDKGDDANDKFAREHARTRQDARDSDAEARRKASMERSRNAWKNPVVGSSSHAEKTKH